MPDNLEEFLEKECTRLETEVGFPMIIRPSYVIGGRGMAIVHDREQFKEAIKQVWQIK